MIKTINKGIEHAEWDMLEHQLQAELTHKSKIQPKLRHKILEKFASLTNILGPHLLNAASRKNMLEK